MYKTTAAINGMACGMCEAHINDVIRKTFPDAKKVSSSHRKKEATFLTEEKIDPAVLKGAIDATGYECLSCETTEYVKKGLFFR